MVVPSLLSPEPPAPDSPHTSLVHSALPLLEPRVSGCKHNCVLGLLRDSLHLSHLSLMDKIPAAFHSHMLFGFLSGSVAVGWGAQLGI